MDYIGLIQKAVDYIEANLCEELSLEKLAACYHVSPTHYYRIFKAVSTYSLKEYILLRRLSEAAKKIRETDCRITEIGIFYGFHSPEAFSRTFRRKFGMCPGEYSLNKNDW